MSTIYRIVLDGRGETTTLEYMREEADARDWAECKALAYAAFGLPNGEIVVKATKQVNGDWRLAMDGFNPCWIRVQEVDDEQGTDDEGVPSSAQADLEP